MKMEDSPLFEDLKKIFPTEDELNMLKRVETELLEGFRKGVITGAEAGQKKYEEKQAGSTLNESMESNASTD